MYVDGHRIRPTQRGSEDVCDSLRPVRVGVHGSVFGAVLKVTFFPGVRANSLAMCKNIKAKVFNSLKHNLIIIC